MNVRELLQRETGLDLADQVAERALATRMAETGITSAATYLQRIAPEELTALIELVVVPESWMFRDPEAFAAAAEFARRKLAAAPGHTLRFLSVPCAGGEEPYTIAMALQDAGLKKRDYQIDAIDLSIVSINRARAGCYTRNAFRGRNLAFRERYFTQVANNEYQIAPALREQVNFAQGNLLAFDVAAQAGRYDVIFCRNLLIYFDEPTTALAISRLDTLLAADGVLFAGYAEVPAFTQNGFSPLRYPGAFALQKRRAAVLPTPRAVARKPLAAPAKAPAPAPVPAKVPAKATVKAAAKVPADPATLLEQARRLADQGDFQASSDACKAALALDPHSAQAYFILGMVSDCRKDAAGAADYWRRCVYLQPDHYDALCHLALLEGQQGNSSEAASYQRRAARVWQRHSGKADV